MSVTEALLPSAVKQSGVAATGSGPSYHTITSPSARAVAAEPPTATLLIVMFPKAVAIAHLLRQSRRECLRLLCYLH